MSEFIPEILTAVISIVGALIVTNRQLNQAFKRDLEEQRTKFMAEQVALELLQVKGWKQRSFSAIRGKLQGFEDNELRKILVRAGAVSFKSADGIEYWGLLSRNRDSLAKSD